MMIADVTMTSARVVVSVAPKNSIGRSSSSVGKVRKLRPHTIIANVCSRIETPIAVINGARRGALRSGR